MARERWTKDRILAVANEVTSRKELRDRYPGAYSAALRLDGVLDNLFPKNTRHWTLDMIITEARQFSSSVEFSKGNLAAHSAARKAGVLHQLFPNTRKGWTRDDVIAEASKYSSRDSFCKGNHAAYAYALRNKMLPDLFKHKYTQWTNEMLESEARKYRSKEEFYTKNRSAHSLSVRRGLLNNMGFTSGASGFKSEIPGCLYVAEIALPSGETGVILGITNRGPNKRYRKKEQSIMGTKIQYKFNVGGDALKAETFLKRTFRTSSLKLGESPLQFKSGTSGEILVGVPLESVITTLIGNFTDTPTPEPW